MSAADKLLLRGYFDRVGPLLDEAIALVPHCCDPMSMSVLLARKTGDARRMADSVDLLLSLGWPGRDEYFRIESTHEVENLAKSLEESGRTQEANELRTKLTESQARDLFVRLTWDGDADFDLLVDEPLGATASYQNPRPVFGGAMIKHGYGSHPEEVYVCPRGFAGDYTIRVSTIYTNPDKPVTRLTLETITHEGTTGEKKQSIDLNPEKPGKPVVVHLDLGRRKKVLPYVDSYAEPPMKAAAPSQLKNAKPPARARGAAPKGAPAPDAKARAGVQ